MSSTRETIARLIHQRVRPRTPFWNIPAHRVPTLHLYRHILRNAPSTAIHFRMRMLWNENRSLTGIEQTKAALRQAYRYLDIFCRANAGDTRLQVLLARYSRLIDVKCEKEYWKYLAAKELVWRAKLRYRPILTGAHFPSSIYHKPLPRMINQPTKLSQMIRWRYKANERRIQRHQGYLETISDLKLEVRAEEALQKLTQPSMRKDNIFGGHYNEWLDPYRKELDSMQASFDRGVQRARTPFPQPLLDQLKAARKERILNKTKERARELRGEVTPSLLKRLRRGPPAHVLSKMTPQQRFLDKVARSPSQVGFVAIAKRKLGRGLKDPDAWLAEESREKKQELDAIAQEIRRENVFRRRRLDRANVD